MNKFWGNKGHWVTSVWRGQDCPLPVKVTSSQLRNKQTNPPHISTSTRGAYSASEKAGGGDKRGDTGESMTLKGLWPVEKPLLKHWVRNKKQQKEENHYALTHIPCAATASSKGQSVENSLETAEQGREESDRKAEHCFLKWLFACFYFSTPE